MVSKPRKRVSAFFITLAILISLMPAVTPPGKAAGDTWDGSADTEWYDSNSSGTYFIIDTAEELAGLATIVNNGIDFSGKTIKLGADIDLSGHDWTPIGDATTKFRGTFDGDGYTISNLSCSSTLDNIGLFGYILFGSIRNLTLSNFSVSNLAAPSGSSTTVGTLAGYCGDTIVTNCHITGESTVTSNVAYTTTMGGLIGSCSGTVSRCSSNAVVSSSNGYATIGGIIGSQSGNIENCCFTGSATNSSDSAVNGLGGIAGYITNGSIKYCYSTGTLTTVSNAKGGIAGINYYSSSSEGDNNFFLSGTADFGYGSYTDNTTPTAPSDIGTTSKSAAELKTSSTYIDKGWDFSGTWANENDGTTYPHLISIPRVSIINIDASDLSSVIVYANLSSDGGSAISAMGIEYRLQGTSEYTQVAASTAGVGDFSVVLTDLPMGIYDIRAYAANGYDTAYGAVHQLIGRTPSGEGTELSPYIIDNAEKLNFIRFDPDAHYVLTTDLDLSGTGFENWVPICNEALPFTGTLDGNGHIISGFTAGTCSISFDTISGLFGYIDYGGSVKKLGVNGSYENSYTTGGIAGINAGTIDQCFNKANISSDVEYASVGGIAGYNMGTISNCYNTGNITVSSGFEPCAAGIAGYDNMGTIIKCYNSGAISGGAAGYAAGIGAYCDSTTINGCFNTGTISGSYIGGVSFGGSPTNCDYVEQDGLKINGTTDSTGQSSSTYFTDGSSGAYSAEVYSDWDFTDIWQYRNADYPELKAFIPIPTVTLSVDNASISENAGVATITATLSEAYASDVTVTLGYSGTATGSGTDYTVSSEAITITAGNTTGTAAITAVNDTLDEDDETVIVDIADVTNAIESGTQQLTVTIIDDDTAPTVNTPDVIIYTDTAIDNSFVITYGTLEATDSDGTVESYGISGGATGGGTVINEVTYDVSKAGIYGTLYLRSSTGNYVFVPDDTAINALSATQSETYTVTATDNGGVTGIATLTVIINGVNDKPNLTKNTGITVNEGGTATISKSELEVTDVDTAAGSIIYTLTAEPTNGTLSGGAIGVSNTFTQDDIDNSRISYTHDGSESASDSFSFTVSDGEGGSIGETTFTITVNPVNDAPTISAPASIDVTEDSPYALTGISFADADAGSNPVSVTLEVPSGTLAATSGGGVTVGGSASSLTLTGTIASINAFITGENVTFTTALNVVSGVTLTVTISDSGNTGSGGTKSASTSVSITVAAVNDAPTISALTSINIESTVNALTGISFSDVDAGTNPVTVTLSVSSGSLTATSGGGVTVGGTASSLTLTGSVSNINAFITGNGVTFTTAIDTEENVTLDIRIDDNGYSGSGGVKSAIDSITLIVVPRVVNVSSSSADGTYKAGDEISILVEFNVPVTVTGIPQLLLETGSTDRAANYDNGSGTKILEFVYTVQAGDNSPDLDYVGTDSLTLNGGTISGNGANAILTLPAPGAAGSLGANTAIIVDTTAPAIPAIMISSDSGTSSTDGVTSSTAQIITVSGEAGTDVELDFGDGSPNATGKTGAFGLFTAPEHTYTAGGKYTISATLTDSAGNKSTAGIKVIITDTIAPSITISADQTISTAAATNGAIVCALTATDLTAISGFTDSLSWSVSGGADAGKFTIDGSNLKINNTGGLGECSYILQVTATDTAGNTNTQTLTVTVAVGPTVDAATYSYGDTASSDTFTYSSGNISAIANLGSIIGYGIDGGTTAPAGSEFIYNSVSYNVSKAGTYGTLYVNSDNGKYVYVPTSDALLNAQTATVNDIFTITATDNAGTAGNSLTITINGVNDTPTNISLSNSSIDENVPGNTTVGTLSSTDADAADTFNYSLTAGAGDTDNASFSIDGGSLRITISPNYEAKSSYSVRIRTTDQGGLWFEKVFTITVDDLNEAPTGITLSNSSVTENAIIDVGSLVSTDPDAGDTFTYSLVPGAGDADNAAFSISDGKLRIMILADFETKSSYSVRIRTTDQGGLWYEEAFTISITDLNENPTDITLSNNTIDENAAANTTVGTLSGTDADAANTFTYSLVEGAGDTDNASFNIDGSSLRILNSPNYEAKSSYSVRIRTTDQGGLWFEKEFTININDIDEAPVISTADTVSVVEGTLAAFTASGSDPEGNAITWSISGGADAAEFSINADTGAVTFVTAPSFGTPADADADNSYVLQITASDGVITASMTVTVIVTQTPHYGTPSVPAPGSAVVEVNGEKHDAGQASTQTTDGTTTTTITVDDTKLSSILEETGDNATITLPANGTPDVVVGVLTGQTVKNMEQKEAVLEIRTETVTYTIPASQINIDAVSSQLGTQVDLKDIIVSVKIAEPPADTVKVIEDAASRGNYQLVVQPVEFEITCTSGDSTVEVSRFNAYVERMIAIPDGVDPSKITTGVVLNADGTLSHVPTSIVEINGKYFAKINSLTNSTYSVIYSPVTFTDVESHWAKGAINDMGSRMVVSGIGNGIYEPERNITRAEFAAIIVKALGLTKSTAESAFNDVTPADWFNGYVDTAVSYSLITGYNSVSFGPNDTITREQAMTILARAMKLTGLSVSLTDSETSALLSIYADAGLVSDFAKADIAACIKAGVVLGTATTTLSPKDSVTRAEAAVMVQRLLQSSGLI
jgi:VCBS repeat-containing protein